MAFEKIKPKNPEEPLFSGSDGEAMTKAEVIAVLSVLAAFRFPHVAQRAQW